MAIYVKQTVLHKLPKALPAQRVIYIKDSEGLEKEVESTDQGILMKFDELAI